MVSSLCFSPVFLPSLGDTAEQDAASEDASSPLFDALMADPRFADLRRILDGPAPGETPIEFATATVGNHPIATVLPEPVDDEPDVENTMIIPVVDAPTAELPITTREPHTGTRDEPWLPDVGGLAYVRQHA